MCLTTGSASAAASRREAHSVFFEMRSTRRCAFAASSAAHSICVSALACIAQICSRDLYKAPQTQSGGAGAAPPRACKLRPPFRPSSPCKSA